LILKNLDGKAWAGNQEQKPKFKDGDFVRLSKVKGVYEKGYTGILTEEMFIVDKVKLMSSVPQIIYKVNDTKVK
jgi:hypothetical protein